MTKLVCLATPEGPRTVVLPGYMAETLQRSSADVVAIAAHPNPGFAVWNRLWRRMIVSPRCEMLPVAAVC